jgi:hypothetical protein
MAAAQAVSIRVVDPVGMFANSLQELAASFI